MNLCSATPAGGKVRFEARQEKTSLKKKPALKKKTFLLCRFYPLPMGSKTSLNAYSELNYCDATRCEVGAQTVVFLISNL